LNRPSPTVAHVVGEIRLGRDGAQHRTRNGWLCPFLLVLENSLRGFQTGSGTPEGGLLVKIAGTGPSSAIVDSHTPPTESRPGLPQTGPMQLPRMATKMCPPIGGPRRQGGQAEEYLGPLSSRGLINHVDGDVVVARGNA